MRVWRFLAFVFLVAALAAHAQEYPSRPIRLITPAAPGGTTDLLARLFGAKLGEIFGQQIIVENRASASGVIAGEMTAKAPPDGYTLLLAYHQHTINAALNANLPYHPVNDFTPITQLTRAGLLPPACARRSSSGCTTSWCGCWAKPTCASGSSTMARSRSATRRASSATSWPPISRSGRKW